MKEISLEVKIVTPVLGGGTRTRMLDDVDIVRAATVRGHLRFWWRALYAASYDRAEELAAAEAALWGRAATESGGRSAVDLRIAVKNESTVDGDDIRPYNSKAGQKTPGAYALWPARAETKQRTPVAERRRPGIEFRLTLTVPVDHEGKIRNAIRAWLLFGGYGGRTRRGVGSLCALTDKGAWHPKVATREALVALFGTDVFARTTKPAIDTPWLAGATLHVGDGVTEAISAWTTALDWLNAFRQGTSIESPELGARRPGDAKRPSISNWPEPDKIRILHRKTKDHPPRHNGTPAWPRAGFGLPIVGQFQDQARDGKLYDEPGTFELRWQPNEEMRRERRTQRVPGDRLASPLILKALPLATGQFIPCALWLNRAYPNGEVILRDPTKGNGGVDVNGSTAPFDRLVANGDTPRFSALAGKRSLRDAFLDWLHATHDTTVVAP